MLARTAIRNPDSIRASTPSILSSGTIQAKEDELFCGEVSGVVILPYCYF